jgi:hypothetical protein
MNKTAVEFVAYELINLDIAYEMGLEKNEFHKLRQEIIKKAKKMEKEQIMDAYWEGKIPFSQVMITEAEQYYNKTFKPE